MKHPHKYSHVKTPIGKLWVCSECPHYMPKHMEFLLPGRKATCNICDNVYDFTPEKMESDQPICDECELARKLRIQDREEKYGQSNSDEPNEEMLAELAKIVIGDK